MFDSLNEWIALALTLLGGLLLGLALHPGGRKWRDRYGAERDAHHAARRDGEAKLSAAEARIRELEADRGRLSAADARIVELERDRDALAAANARNAELEREIARLRTTPQPLPASVTADRPATTIIRPGRSDAGETTASTRRVVGGARSNRGWFDWGPGADPRARG